MSSPCAGGRVREDYEDHLCAKGTLRHPSAQMKLSQDAATGSVYIRKAPNVVICNMRRQTFRAGVL